MRENSEFDDVAGDIAEQYLLFLRGRGPEPDLSGLTAEEQAAMRDQLEVVEALADREPQLPPLQQDPVAIRLGIVGGSPGGSGRSTGSVTDHAGDSHAGHGDECAEVLEWLKSQFGGQVTVDYAPTWKSWTRRGLVPLAQCSALGNTLALFASSPDGWADEPDGVAVFLRRHPDISAVGLVSAEAGQAVIVTAADSIRCIDPVRGWLEPGAAVVQDSLEHVLLRYFERRLPRWDRVTELDVLLGAGDVTSDAAAIIETVIATALRAKPRLAHKKLALEALARLDPMLLAAVIVDVQTARLDDNQLVERLAQLAEGAAP